MKYVTVVPVIIRSLLSENDLNEVKDQIRMTAFCKTMREKNRKNFLQSQLKMTKVIIKSPKNKSDSLRPYTSRFGFTDFDMETIHLKNIPFTLP